jgi:hypothetical protein
MKLPSVASAVGLVAVLGLVASSLPQVALAQSNVGVWKLNLTKSKSSPEPLPKSLTRTTVSGPDGVQITFEGIDADGSRISYSFVAKVDGKDYPISGVGRTLLNGADTVSLKRLDENRTVARLKNAGKVVLTTNQVVSNDGKVLTNTNKGINLAGRATDTVMMFDKQ